VTRPVQAVRRALLGALVLAGLLTLALVGVPGQPPSTRAVDVVPAADTTQFRAGNIISDQLFFDGNAMTAEQVQTFLNAQAPNCKPGSDGTWCLKNYLVATPSMPATATCPGGYVASPSETAATVIARVGQACGISQKVLLVILQKEQGLVTASGSSLYATRYIAAMGYACPDTSACNPKYAGLFNQLYWAANQYKAYAANPRNYGTLPGVVNQIRWSPNAACGSSPVLVENQATAGLYDYTPYQPNAAALAAGTGTGDGCSAYGNRNFWIKFTDWFGSTQVPGAGEVTGRYAQLGGATGSLGAFTSSVVCGLPGGGCYQPYKNGAIYWSPTTGARVVLNGPVRDKWGALGWEAGGLGYPTSDTVCGLAGGGCYGGFQGGSVYWTAATQAHVVSGAVRDEWATTGLEGGYLGYPTTDLTTTPDGRAQYTHFTGGSIYWSAATGAHVMGGPVYTRWAATGWENSPLGLPTTDLAVLPDRVGLFQHFQQGSIYYTPTTGARVVLTPLRSAWAATGWERGPLGYPVSDQAASPGGTGQTVVFQGGSVQWSQATGARVLSGAVQTAWTAAGSDAGLLGLPVSSVATTPDGTAQYAHFQGGSVYSTASFGTRVLPTAIRNGWAASGWENGPLGYPTGDLVTSSDGTVQSMVFQGGTVVASAATGGHAVPAVLLGAWQAAGGVGGTLGLPVSDAGTTPDGKARYQHFQGGSIYSTASFGTRVLPTAIRNGWAASGWENGPLGYPTGDLVTSSDGTVQSMVFQGGTVVASAATGGHAVPAVLLGAWQAAGGVGGTLGLPVSDAGTTPDGKARYQHFQGGSIYSTASFGTRVLPTAVRNGWAASGWENGPLGYPTGDLVTSSDGRTQTMAFQGGVVVLVDGTARAVPEPLASAWTKAGGLTGTLGAPVSGAGRTPDGTGTYQHFEGGSIYSTAQYGTRVLPTALREPWARSGWEGGPLGYPVSDVRSTPDGMGSYVLFQRGSVYWTRATGGHALWGPVLDAWAATGWEKGPLGYPTVDVTATPDGQGVYASFQRGAVYSTARTGAHVLSGDVLAAWADSGWESGPLGYPVSDQATTPDGKGRYAHFEHGSVYATTATGAHVLPLAVRDAWARTGWENGPLGYPTSDARPTPDGGTVQDFQRGTITVSGAGVVSVQAGS